MRKIREMLGNDEKVWVYIDSGATWEKFAAAASEEGFRFGDLPEEKWVSGYVVAVHSNGEMGHLPLFVWCGSFSAEPEKCPRRIDLRAYLEGSDDYICKVSHFRQEMK